MDLDSEGLHEIANTDDANRTADIVFVHGLAGGSHSTWRNRERGFFWPSVLGNDLPECGIWTLGYSAGMSHWVGQAGMAIQHRAQNLLSKMLNRDIGLKPVVFVTHSMGGLMVKEIIVRSLVRSQSEGKQLVSAIRGIVFCGTPHRGADLAKMAAVLSKIFRTQTHLKQMAIGDPMLDTLHDDFLNWQNETKTPVLSFVEQIGLFRKQWCLNLSVGQAVPPESGNPNIVDCDCTPIAADHIALVKPDSRKHDVYGGVLRFIHKVLPEAERTTEPVDSEIQFDDTNRLLLKSISSNIDDIVSYYKQTKSRFPAVQSIDTTVTIDGPDCTIEERTVFQAAATRPQYYLINTVATTRQVSFPETNFAVKVHSAHKIAYLPSGLNSNKLSVLLMFLPPISPNEPAIDFTHSYFIKDAFTDLVNRKLGSDFYSTIVRSDEPVPIVKITFRVSKESTPALRLEPKGSGLGNAVSPKQEMTDPRYRIYLWEAKNVSDEGEVAVKLVVA